MRVRSLVWAGLFASAAGAQLVPTVQPPQPLAPDEPAPQGGPADAALGLPPGFVDQIVLSDLAQAVGVAFVPGGGPAYVWLKSGRVQVLENGQLLAAPLLDIADEVADFADFGLLSLALDPHFAQNGYVYLLYVVDHYHLAHAGQPGYDPAANEYGVDTLARITRYTVDVAGGAHAVLAGSRHVLLGTAPGDGPPVTGKSHGPGTLLFGEDGTLLVSIGDADAGVTSGTAVSEGLMQPKEDVGPWRAQLVDALDGRILRLDPASGDGVPGNPWFDPAAPRAGRSRTWALGLRNPCRMALRPGTGAADPAEARPGTLIVGDVGAETIEELSVVDAPGQDLGWPLHEGLGPSPFSGSVPANLDAPNPSFGQPGCDAPFLDFAQLCVEDNAAPPFWSDPCQPGQPLLAGAPLHVHRRPALDWLHDAPVARAPSFDAGGAAIAVPLGAPSCPVAGASFGGNCSMAGAVAGNADWPAPWRGAYYHADYGLGWIRRIDLAPDGTVLGVELFAQPVGRLVDLVAHPDDGTLFYIDYGTTGAAHLHHILFLPGNLPPIAVAHASPPWGPQPLAVSFDAAASSDPEGGPLQLRWEFSDGTPYSVQSAPVRSLPAEDITEQGTPVALVLNLIPKGSTGFSSHDIEVIRDGDRPEPGCVDAHRQYDTIHVNGLGHPDKGPNDWIGYSFAAPHSFIGLLFQEGINYTGGGWFASLAVQVHGANGWKPVTGLQSSPPYPSSLAANFETFELRFDPTTGDGIRLFGPPGGSSVTKFVTVAELRVLARPTDLSPRNVTAQLVVTDGPGASAADSVTISVGDTPPAIHKLSPGVWGGTFSTLHANTLAVHASAKDAEDAGALSWSWQVVLHHDNHTHPEPPVAGQAVDLVLLPEGACGTGDVYWIEVLCTVVDPLGLADTAQVLLLPDCDRNLNGQDDAAEIAAGLQRDADGDGVIDATQTDCDGDGIPDFVATHFGLVPDGNGDGVPDACDGLTIQKKPSAAGAGPKPK